MNADNPCPIIDEFLNGYEQAYDYYEKVASRCQRQCETLLDSAGIRAMFTSRAKSHARLREKLYKRHAIKKYTCVDDIHRDIVDFAGVRVALYFPGDQDKVRSLIETNFDVGNVKRGFVPTPTPIYQKRFSGYDAVHYHVRLREGQVDDTRYTKPRIEIQVASVLMHSWAEVEHDLIYKPGDVPLSEDEHAILDQINGLMIAGEIALARLQKAINTRASQPENPFADHYELAMYLRQAIEPSFPEGVSAIIMGRVDVLFRFLQLAELDRPNRFVAEIDPDTDAASVVEQVVDQILRERQDFEEKYDQAREEVGARNPYSSTSERLTKLNDAEAYGNFLLRWSALENFVMLLARTRGYDASAMGPSQVVDRLRKLEIVDAETLDRINDIRKLRIKVVHGPTPVDLSELSEAARFLDHLMRASQFRLLEGIEETIKEANVASSTDRLTGLSNRRAFELRVSHEFTQNPQQNLSLLMLDLDGFKQVNDAYGHSRGDELLRAVAETLRANSRSLDVIARFGGDEIGVLLPDTDKEQAVTIAEQYRQAVEAMPLPFQATPPLTGTTVSVGVSTITPAATDRQQFFHEADEALYRAKQLGRNRVVNLEDAL